MNSLIVFEDELDGLGSEQEGIARASLRGARAVYAYGQHELREGLEVRVSILGRSRGMGRVVCASEAEVVLDLFAQRDERPGGDPIHLVVALPRPQTVKKVLEIAACFGVRTIYFTRAERVVKSYFDSPVLEKEERTKHLLKGLEQVYDYELPQIHVVDRFRSLLEDHLGSLIAQVPPGNRLVAHTKGGHSLSELSPHMNLSGHSFLLAIGPESGWNEFEIEQFQTLGIQPWVFGDRALRVEHALVFALGQLAGIRNRGA